MTGGSIVKGTRQNDSVTSGEGVPAELVLRRELLKQLFSKKRWSMQNRKVKYMG